MSDPADPIETGARAASSQFVEAVTAALPGLTLTGGIALFAFALRQIPGVTCSMPAGAFYAYPNLRGAMDRAGIKTPLEFADRLLKEANVAVVPGEAFGTDDHVRMSYATSMKELERGLDRIHKFVESLV